MRVCLVILMAAMVLRGQTADKLYSVHCSLCHGPKGEGGKGPSLRTSRFTRAQTDADLFALILGGIPGTEMPPSRMTEKETWSLVQYVRELGRVRSEPIAGDPVRGRALYLGKGGCQKCHMVNGEGGRLGPELSDIGARRSRAYLQQSLTDPAASVPESFTAYRRLRGIPDNFLLVRVVTADGRRVTGVRLNEDPFSIQVRDLADHLHHFDKGELKELHKDWGKTLMPSYKGIFSSTELDDVAAYLVSLRGAQ